MLMMFRTTHNPTIQSKRRGFTLVEILMVVVILGIVSAVIIPQLGTRDDLKAAAAARLIMSDLIYALNRAIATQTKHYVRFNGQQYSISNNTALTPIEHPLKPASSSGLYVITLGPGGTPGLETVSISSTSFAGQTTIGFDDLGQPFAFSGTLESA
ncbi:MAG: pilus assembly FimT family protein, partial [Tepidisphaeraceae bacterium]